jgi:hypothetical protein
MPRENSFREPVETVPLIEGLPIEVLEEIFTLYYLLRAFSPLILKLVCRRWCMIVDGMPIMRSNIVLAPDIHCLCCRYVGISAYQVQCKAISQLNRALYQLKGLKCTLNALGCNRCALQSSFYDTDLDKEAFNLRCRSLEFSGGTMDLVVPLLESLDETTNLESFTAKTLVLHDQANLIQEVQRLLLMKAPRTLRVLGPIVADDVTLTDQHRQFIRRLDHVTIRCDRGSRDATKLQDLFCCLVNISKLEVKYPDYLPFGTPIPLTAASPRLQYLHLSGSSAAVSSLPKEVYVQLETLKFTEVQYYPSPTDQRSMPNLRYLHIHDCSMGLRWINAPKLEYLSVFELAHWSSILFGSHTNEWSIRPRIIAIGMAEKKDSYEGLWQNVEEVELHNSLKPWFASDMARHLLHSVQQGEERLHSLRRISILDKTHKGAIMAVDDVGEKLLLTLKSSPEYGGPHPIQVRHKWQGFERDMFMRDYVMTAEASGWTYWE